MSPQKTNEALFEIVQAKSAEITRLKEQLARTERERDQAIAVGGIQVIERGRIVSCTNHIDNKDVVENINDLYMHLTHLAGKVEE